MAVKDEQYVAYVGTYTNGTSKGIHIYDVDVKEGLLHLRKVVPVNNSSYLTRSRNRKILYSIADEGVVAFRLKNYAGRDGWRNIIVVLNATREEQSIQIPQATYTAVCARGVISLFSRGLFTFTGSNTVVAPQSAQIIHD